MDKEVFTGKYRIAVFVDSFDGHPYTHTIDNKEEAEAAKTHPNFKCFATRWRRYETWKGKY